VKYLIVCSLLLASCHEERPPAPTTKQAQQLNEAADMLDNLATNEEGPEQSPGPSNSTN